MESQEGKKKWYFRWWAWCLWVFIFLFIVGSLSDANSSSSVQSGSATPEAPKEQAIAVSAVQLATEYKDNQVAADIKYKDKLVEVSGTIDTIGKDVLEDSYVSLEGAGIVNRIQCYVSKDNEASIASLVSGKKVTLRGRVDGGTFNVIIKNCEVVN